MYVLCVEIDQGVRTKKKCLFAPDDSIVLTQIGKHAGMHTQQYRLSLRTCVPTRKCNDKQTSLW